LSQSLLPNLIRRGHPDMTMTRKDTPETNCWRSITIKLLCLLLAITVWGFTLASRERSLELELVVEVTNTPPGYVAGMNQQNTLSVTLSGPAAMLKRVAENNSKISLDMRGAAAPGKSVFSNLDKYLKLQQGIKVTRITPAAFEIELQKR
jgi:hypothetical protein